MAARTLRRRQHGNIEREAFVYVESPGLSALNEPLLGDHNEADKSLERPDHETQMNSWDERRIQRAHWTLVFSQLVAQWAQWIANIIIGSGLFLGRFFPVRFINNRVEIDNYSHHLSSLQEERLRKLQQRLAIPFDASCPDHQESLKQLWKLAYPNRELPSIKTELWKEMGWQGPDPSTDFRGGGFISLENLIFFASKYPDSFQSLLHKRDGIRAEWEYPFAVAGINISFMLVQFLDLQSGRPKTVAGNRFLELLEEDERAFDHLYCVAFQMMDAQWLAKRASYMEFNEVLKSTRNQLERELSLEDLSSIKDIPAYNMLIR